MSELYKLNLVDFLEGAVSAVGGAVIGTLIEMLKTGWSIDWRQVGLFALVSFLTYLKMKFLSNAKGENAVIGAIQNKLGISK